MATWSYGVNDAETVKKWSRKLFREALKSTWLYRFMGTSDNSIIQLKDADLADAGDRVTVTLRMQPSGDGIAGDGTLEGNEEALTTYTDNLLIDQLRHAVRTGGRMSEQRVPFDMREECRLALTDWWADRIDDWGFNQLAGDTTAVGKGTDLRYTGLNATITPDAAHSIFAEAETAAESSVSTGSVVSLSLIDKCVARAKTITPPIRPVRMNGAEWYVMFLHPYQIYNLRTSTATNDWADIQKAAMNGGLVNDNPIFTGAHGVYNGTIIHESTRVPKTTDLAGNTDAGVYRALFCGAQAGIAAFSKANSPTRMTWVEELFDYGNQLGVSAGMIAGVKKAQFNSADFGVLTVRTYAERP